MGDSNNPETPRMFLIFLAPLAAFALWRIYLISPMVFVLFAFLIASGAALMVFNSTGKRALLKRCALCNGNMVNLGSEPAINGATDHNDGSKLDAIHLTVYRCEKCENEYHELNYGKSSTGDLEDYKLNLADAKALTVIFGGALPAGVGFNAFEKEPTTRDDYRRSKAMLADEVILHNQRNGFNDNPIKINLEE